MITEYKGHLVIQDKNEPNYAWVKILFADIPKLCNKDEVAQKPKPLLADAQPGWLAKLLDGTWFQLLSRYSDPRYNNEISFGGRYFPHISYDIDGKPRHFGGQNIIHTEPLAPEGTAEWAWQMLMLQKPVSHPAEGEFQDTYYTKEGFVRCMAKTGWQLYKEKPKPLLAGAKVGDLCKRRDGKYVQVDSYSNDRPCPVMCKSDIGGQDCFTLDGRNHNAVNNDKDIVHTEPLATEGTAEWALQMMRLGKKIINANSTFPFILKADRIVRCGDDISWDIGHWLRVFDDTFGWKLYEPKPEPEYKVGDWVEFNPGNNPTQVEIVDIDGDKLYYNTRYAGKTIETHIYASAITRKLDPSEVRVKVVLEGTVERHDGNPQYWFKLRSSEYNYALISIDMLDPATRTLVESLLKAQEENNG